MNDGKIMIEVKDGKVNIAIDKTLSPVESLQLLIGLAQSVLKDQSTEKPKIEKPDLQKTIFFNEN